MSAPSHHDLFTDWLHAHAVPLAHLDPAAPLDGLEPLRWMRRHNRTASPPVRFAGIGIPAAGGSLLPALAPVADCLCHVDSETLSMIQTAMRIAESFAGGSGADTAPAWARLPTLPNRTPSAPP
ncbi:erythromycin esterase family protein [Streptomyces sp. Wb2n-11]|uniref:erythromycin esterase family protein n=1 Tax=Streptomyces sp. Wb2n-11 TaxID=1030533 RepID=UPI000AE0DE0C|nr:erythromycin esterase family protein [Streptomyces sp. Wb2n-11]